MKSNLPKAERLTENEKNVIDWAFNFVHSIVAGDYHLPKPMNYTMNTLQDVVWDLANERGISVEDGCTEEYRGFHKGYWEGVEEKLKGKVCGYDR